GTQQWRLWLRNWGKDGQNKGQSRISRTIQNSVRCPVFFSENYLFVEQAIENSFKLGLEKFLPLNRLGQFFLFVHHLHNFHNVLLRVDHQGLGISEHTETSDVFFCVNQMLKLKLSFFQKLLDSRPRLKCNCKK